MYTEDALYNVTYVYMYMHMYRRICIMRSIRAVQSPATPMNHCSITRVGGPYGLAVSGASDIETLPQGHKIAPHYVLSIIVSIDFLLSNAIASIGCKNSGCPRENGLQSSCG